MVDCPAIDIVSLKVSVNLDVVWFLFFECLSNIVQNRIVSPRKSFSFTKRGLTMIQNVKSVALCGLVFGLLHILQLSLVTFFHRFKLSGVANVFVELLIANCITPRGTP